MVADVHSGNGPGGNAGGGNGRAWRDRVTLGNILSILTTIVTAVIFVMTLKSDTRVLTAKVEELGRDIDDIRGRVLYLERRERQETALQ